MYCVLNKNLMDKAEAVRYTIGGNLLCNIGGLRIRGYSFGHIDEV